MDTEKVTTSFQFAFNKEPELKVRAPGRINLIGEHTDYNNGFVFPAAVDKEITFAFGLSGDSDLCKVISVDFDETFEFRLTEMKPLPHGSWQNYIMGVAAEISKSGRKLEGFNIVFSGNIPQGAGMSSSAALECGTCFGLNELFDLKIPKLEMVKMSQKAEHNYAGVQCGIMDQFASMMGKSEKALRLDCQNLNFDYFPIELDAFSLILCNSNVEHNLASSEYNVRRQQCEEGVSIIQKAFPEVHSLRDATMEQLVSLIDEIPEVTYRRCEYILKENSRVEAFAFALEKGDLIAAGEILKQAQSGMRFRYAITCPEIDFLADFANAIEDIAGARMMGGGFGGCTINLVRKGSENSFISELDHAYQNEFDKEITPISVNIANGVSLIDLK